ncbi:MAG: hypothetical protein ACLQPV_09680 [Vulcanimicrobiaceae bacterium]
MTRPLVPIVLTFAAALSFTPPAAAAVNREFSFPVARAAHPLALDPSLADPAWQAGKVPNGPQPWEDVTTRGPAPHATTAYMLYDDHYLYVAFQAEQQGTPVVATQSTNDGGFGIDDFVGVALDPSGTGTQAYFFETTPRGIRYEQASENTRYRPHWQAAAAVNSATGSWSAVLIVPLDVLRIRPGAKQSWRVNFVRQVAAKAEHYSWAYDGIMQDAGAGNWPVFTDARFWAQATGFDFDGKATVRPKPRLDVFGAASVGSDRHLFQQANGDFLPEPARPVGLDVSVPITQTINFVGTLHPDFSNVEIDQQTIAPQEFRRQVLEYRPFFAQGANYLEPVANGANSGSVLAAPGLVFYSPDIGPFEDGGKVEGTFGNQSFAALTFHGYDVVTDNPFDDTAFGYQHALGDHSFLYWADGVLAHHGSQGDDTTIETGAAGRNNKSGFVWAVNHDFEDGSWVPQGSATSTNGFLDVHKPNYEVLGGYVDISPNYNPIDGYTANSDIRGLEGFANVTGSTHSIKNWNLFVGADRLMDDSGAIHQADTQIGFNAAFKDGFSIDGLGPNVGLLREYGIPAGPGCTGAIVGQSYFTGFPCYKDGVTNRFNLFAIPIGYGDGTPTPIDASTSWGPYGTNYQHLYSFTTTRPFGHKIVVGLEYDGSLQRAFSNGELNSQWLRRISLGYQATADSAFTVGLRDINGTGGFSTPGINFSAGYAARLHGGDELYVNWGTPAANATLDRLIVKFVFHAGAESGT